MTLVSLRGVGKRYGEHWAVRDLDLELAGGETLALIGPSGSGKTTTLRMINRLTEPSSGRIVVAGRDTAEVDVAQLRRGIGYAIQDVGLFPHYTVSRNVGVVPRLLGWSHERIAERVGELLDLVGLPLAEYGERYPHQLSGGQRQRVGIARALAADPQLVLLDEPFGALDPITRHRLRADFAELARRSGKSFVLVTHDIVEAVQLGTRVAVMHEGRLVRCAPPAELVRDPGHDTVRELLGHDRHQLRWMTTRLSDLPRRSDAPEQLPVLPEDCTVWRALGELERSEGSAVRLPDGTWLERHDLLTGGAR